MNTTDVCCQRQQKWGAGGDAPIFSLGTSELEADERYLCILSDRLSVCVSVCL